MEASHLWGAGGRWRGLPGQVEEGSADGSVRQIPLGQDLGAGSLSGARGEGGPGLPTPRRVSCPHHSVWLLARGPALALTPHPQGTASTPALSPLHF